MCNKTTFLIPLGQQMDNPKIFDALFYKFLMEYKSAQAVYWHLESFHCSNGVVVTLPRGIYLYVPCLFMEEAQQMRRIDFHVCRTTWQIMAAEFETLYMYPRSARDRPNVAVILLPRVISSPPQYIPSHGSQY